MSQESTTNKRTVIELQNIKKIYKVGSQEVRAVDDVSFKITDNEYVAIMGHSGSGKSTLMNLIGCLDKASEGKYFLDEQDTTKLVSSKLAHIRNERIGFVFQSFELLNKQSALKNVQMPLLYSNYSWFRGKKLAAQALERVGLAGRLGHRPNQLSGGEKQRVAIARALICKPTILLADEPTGNLDTKTSEEIMQLFADLHKDGQTIVMVTHEEDIAVHSERVIRMQDGKLLYDMPTEEYRKEMGL